jgi:hypothetical protein
MTLYLYLDERFLEIPHPTHRPLPVYLSGYIDSSSRRKTELFLGRALVENHAHELPSLSLLAIHQLCRDRVENDLSAPF